jgi:hypothetical protein
MQVYFRRAKLIARPDTMAVILLRRQRPAQPMQFLRKA